MAEFWAKRTKRQVGPCATREEALRLFRETYPLTAAERRKRTGLFSGGIGRILTGYGSDGPWFDMRWHDAERDD
jgi:hypothetical protein